MSFPYKDYFPYEKPRDEQDEAIDFTLDAFLTHGKRFVILELATGVGKSGVAIAVARYMQSLRQQGLQMPLWRNMPEAGEKPLYQPGAYFLTTQKALQEQYIKDFGTPKQGKCGKLRSIKSSANYQCGFFKQQSCGESLRMVKHERKGTDFWRTCIMNCCYKKAKQEFLDSTEGVTNFSYFLAETTYAGKLEPRELLVIDESHNVENELSKFIEVTFSEKFAKQALKLKMPYINTPIQALKWIEGEYIPRLKEHLAHVSGICKKLKGFESKLKELSTYAKQFDMMDKHICKINRFLDAYTTDNWVMNLVAAKGRSMRKIEFKPVDVAPFAESSLFRMGDRVILMSATILNRKAFCESLGIKQEDAAFVSIGSPFPKENRPIFHIAAGSMARASIEETLPNLTAIVKQLMDVHKGEKGIIHCLDQETPVLMSDGSEKAISKLSVGDSVISWNEDDESFVSESVEAVLDQGEKECIEFTLENGKKITCTSDHKFLTKNRGWTMAKDLDENDDLIEYE